MQGRERKLVEIHAFAVQQARALRMREQLLVAKRGFIVLIQKPYFARKTECKTVQQLGDLRRTALLDENIAEARRDGNRIDACQFRRNRSVDVRLDRVVKHDMRTNLAIKPVQRP